jgi:hypothetical protein
VDGMIIHIITILVWAATNPFNTGYCQGDALAPLEVVTACVVIFGKRPYSGYPGELLVDKMSKASYAHTLVIPVSCWSIRRARQATTLRGQQSHVSFSKHVRAL